MTSLYRAINDAAFEMNLNKNQLLVVNAIMNQTLGYGKTSDPLTDKRIAEITGIRVDRLRPAINAVVKKGLFDRKPHKRFGHEYSIGKTFLEAHQGDVYTPSAPKKRNASEKENPISRTGANPTQTGKDLPEKAIHTITNPHLSNQQQQPTQNQTYSNQQQQTESNTSSHQQPQQSVKLFFAELEQIPNSFAIETSANTRVEFAIGTATESEPQTNTEPKAEEAMSSPETLATLKKLLAIMQQPESKTEATTETLHSVEPTTDNTSLQPAEVSCETPAKQPREEQVSDPVCCRDDECDEKKTDNATELVVPKTVGVANIDACNRAFQPLSHEQKQKVLQVFNHNSKTGTINNATGYFIGLTRTAKTTGLTVPHEAIVKAEPSAEAIAADKAQERRHDLWSKFIWLQENAERQEIDMASFAEQMGLEEAYAMYANVSKTVN